MTTAASLTTDRASLAESPQTGGSRATSRLGICWALYWLTIRQHLHGKRWMAAVLLFLVPVAMAILIRSTRSGAPSLFREFVLAWILIPQALLPLVALLYASGVIQDEQEEQTITYLLVRPISKWLLYVIKMAATWSTTIVLVVALTAVTYAANYVSSEVDFAAWAPRCGKAALILSLATVTYCSLFGAISLLTRRTLVVGIVYTAVVEGVLASLPLSLRLLTVIYYTRLIAYRSLDFVVRFPGGEKDDVAATVWLLNIKDDAILAEHPSLLTSIEILLGASLVCTVLAAWLCSQREFHVKTPETQ